MDFLRDGNACEKRRENITIKVLSATVTARPGLDVVLSRIYLTCDRNGEKRTCISARATTAIAIAMVTMARYTYEALYRRVSYSITIRYI